MTIINSAVVGTKFHPAGARALSDAAQGERVALVREPDNEFDPNAIAVHINGHKCGFMPRAQAERLATDMDAGKPIMARVYGTKLEIEITEEDDK